MKSYGLKRLVIGLLLVVGTLARAADEDYRKFKSSDGREILASIIGCDADAGNVEVEVKGGKQGRIPLSSLSPEDQAYVRDWYKRRACFLSDDLFRIKLTEEDDGWKKHMGTQEERFTRYTLQLENRGNTDLNDIRIVCCEIREKDGATRFSHFDLETSMASAGGTVEEEKVLRSFRNTRRKILDSVIGVRMRLYWTAPDGRELMREVSAPRKLSDEKYPWKDLEGEREKPFVDLTPEEWRVRFLSEDLFEIKLTEDDDGWIKDLGTQEQRYTGYVIKLSNHGDADLNNIRIVCCEIREKDGGVNYSHFDLETTALFAKQWIEEGKVLRSFRNKPRGIIDSVIGLRIRLYWTSPDGSEFMREICSPEKISNQKYPWKDPEKQEDQLAGEPQSQQFTGSISDVSSNETKHTTKKRGTYDAQTFEYTCTIGPCKSYRTKSFFEFKDRRGKITFMASGSNHPHKLSESSTYTSVLNIDAEEHGLKNVELNAYWIQIYDMDESGKEHLVAEAHDGCTSLEELKKRNPPPIGV